MGANLPAKSRFDEFKVMLTDDKRVVSNIESVLPKNMSMDTLRRMAFAAAIKMPNILECTNQSLMFALMECGKLGLYPDGRMAAIVPFKVKGVPTAVFVPMYQGLVELAYATGKYKSIRTAEVYSKDEFVWQPADAERPIIHRPFIGKLEDRGDVLGCWALLQTIYEGLIPEWMNIDEIDAVMKSSAGYKSGNSPWNNPRDLPAMRRKTVLKRDLKIGPKSPELQQAINSDNAYESGEVGKVHQFGGMVMPEGAPEDMKKEPTPVNVPLQVVLGAYCKKLDIKDKDAEYAKRLKGLGLDPNTDMADIPDEAKAKLAEIWKV